MQAGIRAAAGVIVGVALLGGAAEASSRSLKLYNTHTGERVEITFKKNGRFIPSALRDLNQFLRDWRRNEPIKMDPELFDLVWDVYQKSGSRDHIHVVSAYRSPATNNMLRRRSRGVAKASQHTRGKAMDFFLPDVKISKLRKIGLRNQIGGVGYYPKSNSPFVHMDTGRVRHWPRMTRKQLASVFPDGKTIHVPSDGKPMPRYKQAQAELKRRDSGQQIVVASAAPARTRTPPARIRSNEDAGALIRPVPANRSNTGTNFISSLFSNNSGSDTAASRSDSAPTPPGAIASNLTRAPVPTILPGVKATQGVPAAAEAAFSGAVPLHKPELSPALEVAPEPVANEVPILVAALPPSKPRPIAPEPVVLAALPSPVPSNPADAISALADRAPSRLKIDEAAPGVLAYASAAPRQTSGSTASAASSQRALPQTFAGVRSSAGSPGGAVPADRKTMAVAALQGASSDNADLRAFEPQRRADSKRPQASITGSFPPEHDPFARFAALPDRDEPRFLSSDVSTRTQAFATLRHPDQRSLNGLMGRPARLLMAQFDGDVYGALRTDQFMGPAVVALPVVATR